MTVGDIGGGDAYERLITVDENNAVEDNRPLETITEPNLKSTETDETVYEDTDSSSVASPVSTDWLLNQSIMQKEGVQQINVHACFHKRNVL